jgi:hypothetical protein
MPNNSEMVALPSISLHIHWPRLFLAAPLQLRAACPFQFRSSLSRLIGCLWHAVDDLDQIDLGIEQNRHFVRWFEAIRARPATVRAYYRAKQVNTAATVSEESRRLLFGQSAATVAAQA